MKKKKTSPTKPAPLREYKVKLTLCKPGERAVKEPENPDNDGLKTKLGGAPDWIQEEQWQRCAGCKAPMAFVGQIDSIEIESKKNPHSQPAGKQDYMWGDAGMIYVFYCFTCASSANVVQYY